MSLPEISTPELILQYNAAKKHAEQALVESHGERTPKVLHFENVGLRLLVQLKDREIAASNDKQADDAVAASMRDREIQQLKAKQAELLRFLEDRKDWRTRCFRAEKAVRSANRVRDEYYRALMDAKRSLPRPSTEDLRKSFGEPEKKPSWSDEWTR